MGHPLVVAHRGASRDHPENTLEAFEAAVAAGAGAVEFDVRVTADGHGVVLHDATLDRTTDRTGAVRDLTVDDVRRSRIDGSAGGVPMLHEVLEVLSGRIAVDVEIKNVPGEPDFEPDRERAVEVLHRALDDTSFVGDVIVSSFNPLSLAASRRARPELATGLLTTADVPAEATIRFAADQGHRWALPFVGALGSHPEEAVAAAHATGLLLGTWIVDEPSMARELATVDVDALATNDPATIVAALGDR